MRAYRSSSPNYRRRTINPCLGNSLRSRCCGRGCDNRPQNWNHLEHADAQYLSNAMMSTSTQWYISISEVWCARARRHGSPLRSFSALGIAANVACRGYARYGLRLSNVATLRAVAVCKLRAVQEVSGRRLFIINRRELSAQMRGWPVLGKTLAASVAGIRRSGIVELLDGYHRSSSLPKSTPSSSYAGVQARCVQASAFHQFRMAQIFICALRPRAQKPYSRARRAPVAQQRASRSMAPRSPLAKPADDPQLLSP